MCVCVRVRVCVCVKEGVIDRDREGGEREGERERVLGRTSLSVLRLVLTSHI